MKRYNVEIGCGVGDPYCECIENGSGDWVRHEDATARIAELKAENAKLREALDKIACKCFTVLRPCDCCDNGVEGADCTCFDYSLSDEMKRVLEMAEKALGGEG